MSQRHPEPKANDRPGQKANHTASYMADRLCKGFIYHDQREREKAIEAFNTVDQLQFAHLDERDTRRAAEGYVDALWAKDEIENSCRVGGEIDPDALVEANWDPVRRAFERRAEAAGINREYAELTTEAWIKHKTENGDYWTPTMRAQMLELRVALQEEGYPHKSRSGLGGFGPEPARYVLGIEHHDAREWEQARDSMIPYFQRILDAHDDSHAAD